MIYNIRAVFLVINVLLALFWAGQGNTQAFCLQVLAGLWCVLAYIEER